MQLGAAMFAATFSMEAFTPWGGRRIRVMGTRGFIEGDEKGFAVYDFCTGKKRVWAKKVSEIAEYKGAGHADGDARLLARRGYAQSGKTHKFHRRIHRKPFDGLRLRRKPLEGRKGGCGELFRFLDF